MVKSFSIIILVLGFGFSVRADRPEIDPDRNPVIPYRGIAFTANDIPTVRKLAQQGSNAELVETIFRVTDEWMKRSNEEITRLMPTRNDVFAYGAAGDPKTGQEWPRFGRSGNMCSLDRPGEVRSPHTGDVYGIQKPGEEFYDKGNGWVRPSDGRIFYFKGIWNSFVVDAMHEGIDHMAMAYLLTGDPKIAEKALFMLDHLAALRTKLPIRGYATVDWPHPTAKEIKKGFFRYMGNIANQRTINSLLALDILGRTPYAAAPSPHGGRDGVKRSVFDHIAANYFDIYEEFYLEQRALTNHASILIANILAQGVFFGNPEYLKQGIDGTYAFIDNTIDRDGDYIEVSGGYGRLGRDYGGRMIALLANYSPENYPNAAALPSPSSYPYALRFGDDPRWYQTAVGMQYRLPIMGRYPQYGDMNADRAVLINRDNEWLAKSRALYLRMLYHQTSREPFKREIENLYVTASTQKQSALPIEDLLLYGISQWAEPKAPSEKKEIVESSELIGGKKIAILRSGEGRNRRALFMRGGINSYHGHDDQMAIVPYGNGMVLQGEYGYKWAGTPDHLGWGTRAVGHLTAVVDEDLPAPYLYKGFAASIPAPSASITGFLGRSPAQLVEMSNPGLWRRSDLRDYRRTAWMVDIDEIHYYFVDFFQIVGGRTHDYVWNAPYSKGSDGEAFQLEGVEPVSSQGVWTLASLSGAHRRKPWNQPGQSWGERLDGSGGKIIPLAGEKELPTTKWNPEPGNGYGMIWDVKSAQTSDDWQAQWKLVDDRHRLKAHLLNYDGMTAVTGKAPALVRDTRFNTIVGRRTGGGMPLQSRFANVVQLSQSFEWPLRQIERINPSASKNESDAMGVRVETKTGDSDLLLASRQPQEIRTKEARLIGRNAFVRFAYGGEVTHISMQKSTLLEAGNWKIEAAAPAFEAEVIAVETREEESRLTIRGELPAGTVLAGEMLLISSAPNYPVPYPATDYYSVETIERDTPGQSTLVFKKQSLIEGYLYVQDFAPGTAKVNLAWRNEVAGLPGSFGFRGRGVVPAEETTGIPKALVRNVAFRELELTSLNGITPGMRLKALVAKPGDRVTMPLTVTMSQQAPGEYRLRTTGVVNLSLTNSGGARLLASVNGAAATEVGRANESGAITARISPEELGSGEITLRVE